MGNLKLIIIFWLASIAMPGISFALGLGEIEVSSFLNQPLKAEIKVISARSGEINNLLVSLASRDSFARAGLSRPNYLSDLNFAVKKNETGDQAIILVTTKDAIKEPFLNFLVEADWSKGRVLREFTILLDPPFFADGAALAPSSIAEGSAAPMASSSPMSSEVDSIQSTVTTAPSNVANNADLNSIVVKKGDALWTIANQFKDSKHSMGQVMLAMQRANPNAFSNKNINNLKIGAVLRAPTADELDQLNKQEAYALVLEQNGLWDSYVARVTGTSISIANDEDNSDSDVKQDSKDIARHTYTFDKFTANEIDKGNITSDMFNKEDKQLIFHGHCQQKALTTLDHSKKMLSIPENYSVEMIPSGCCGMAGSFGYESEHFDVSMKVGELVLLPTVRKHGEEVIVVAPGTSCRHEINACAL